MWHQPVLGEGEGEENQNFLRLFLFSSRLLNWSVQWITILWVFWFFLFFLRKLFHIYVGVYVISWGFFFIGYCRMWSTFLCVTQWVLATCFINSCCSLTQLWPTLCDPMYCSIQASLSFTISWTLLKLMSTESVMPSNHLILCHPLLNLPSIFPSIRVFSNDLAICIRWPKY